MICCPCSKSREYWMIYRWLGLLAIVWWLLPHPLAPSLPSVSSTGDTQEDLERETTCWRERGGREKAWSSINHSILSDLAIHLPQKYYIKIVSLGWVIKLIYSQLMWSTLERPSPMCPSPTSQPLTQLPLPLPTLPLPPPTLPLPPPTLPRTRARLTSYAILYYLSNKLLLWIDTIVSYISYPVAKIQFINSQKRNCAIPIPT